MASNAFYQAFVEILPEGSKILPTLNRQMASAGDAAGKTGGEKLGSGLLGGVKSVVPAITGLVAGALGALALGSVAKGGLDRLLNIEDAQAKLKGLGNDAATVDAIMTNALASVRGTAFGLDAAATTAAGAVAAGIKPGEELEKYLKLTADTATIAGTSLEDMGSIINKTTTSGKVFTDNLNQLADRGIPIFQYLADEYGVSADELSQMVQRGEVDSETFRRVLEKNIGGAALASGDTTRGAFKNMLASLNRVAANVLSGVFPKFKTVFQGITSFLGPIEDKAKVVGVALGSFFDRTGQAAVGLFDILARGDFTAAFREATGLVEDSPIVDFLFTVREKAIEAGSALRENLGPIFGSIGDALAPVIPQLFEFVSQFSPLALLFKTLAPEIPQIASLLGDTLGKVLDILVDSGAASKLADGFTDIITALVPLIPKMLELLPTIVDIIPSLVDLATSVLPPLVDLLGALLPPAVDLLKGAIDLLKPVVEDLTDNLGGLFDGLKLVIDYLSGDIDSDGFLKSIVEVGGVIGWLSGLVRDWVFFTSNSLNTIIAGFKQAVAPIVQAFVGIRAAAEPVFGWFITYVFPLVQAFAQLVTGVFGYVQAFVTTSVVALYSIVQNAWQGIYDFVATIVSNVYAFIMNVWGGLVALIQGIFNDAVQSGIGEPLNVAVSIFETFRDRIIGFFADAGQWLMQAGVDIIGGLIRGLESALGGLTGFLNGVTELIPEVKGPPSRDKVLLRNSGRLIMGGLLAGLQDGSGPVVDELQSLTGSLAVGDVGIPNVASTVRGMSAQATSAGARYGSPIDVTVNGAPGQSAETVGRIVVDGINFTQRLAG